MTADERSPDLDQLRAWIEEVAAYFAQHGGWPPITGRTLGWLLVCDPPEQSAAEISEAVQASRASLTATLRLLQASGLVQPVTRAGGRTTYYRVADDAWARALRQRFAGLAGFLTITNSGLALLGGHSPRAARMRAAHEVYSWLAAEIEPLWERWDKAANRTRPSEET